MCKASELVNDLTIAEIEALTDLCDGPIRKQMDPMTALKLMGLGLVELSCGQLERTPLGNRTKTLVQKSQMPRHKALH